MSNKMPKAASAKTVSALKRSVAVFIVLLISICVVFAFKPPEKSVACYVDNKLQKTSLRVNGAEFATEIATQAHEQSKGLSDRDCLEDNRAMLFTYMEPGDYCYWMKNMRFAIDMVWLDQEKRVINIAAEVTPESYPQPYCPERPAMYVIEVSAGVAETNNWTVGTQFNF
jgi:uncharacterized membrane protein (UPF0127 family)